MYITNYKNEQEVIILSALSDKTFATLTIDGDKQTMNLMKGKWKKVVTSGNAIIEYSDSEGNYWDIDYNSKFPYSYDTLDKEFINSVKYNLISQVKDLEIIETKINNALIDVEDEEITTNIKDIFTRKNKALNVLLVDCDNIFNKSSHPDVEMYDECIAEPTIEGNNLGELIRLSRNVE